MSLSIDKINDKYPKEYETFKSLMEKPPEKYSNYTDYATAQDKMVALYKKFTQFLLQQK